MAALVKKMVDAAASLNYGGEVETWTRAWTFPNTLLFTITITSALSHLKDSSLPSSMPWWGCLFSCCFWEMWGMPWEMGLSTLTVGFAAGFLL
jgi:hypothetical protein